MKILLVSISSIHFKRWVENLKDTKHELYWFDVLDRGGLQKTVYIKQFTLWKKRKFAYIKGEHFLKKKVPNLYFKLLPFLETTVEEQLEKIINDIKPDLVHSFEMQSCSYPILTTMLKFPKLKWLYSCWGSDLYYYKDFEKHNKKIKEVLNRVNFLHTDCYRDYEIAKKIGFKGSFLGVIPGGGGFKIKKFEEYKKPINERNIILIKGYEHKFGRALNVIKAINVITEKLLNFEIIIFGAHKSVLKYIKNNNLLFKVYHRDELSHIQLIKLMGKSKIYIGNSISDGMPNTLLESIMMGVFPIQSNPGNVTSEIIENGLNGLLIDNPNNINEIKLQILNALDVLEKDTYKLAIKKNIEITKEKLSYNINQQKIVTLYQQIEDK